MTYKRSLMCSFFVFIFFLNISGKESTFESLAEHRLRCYTEKTKRELTAEELTKKETKPDFSLPQIDDHTLHKAILNLFSKTEDSQHPLIESTTWTDLEIPSGEHALNVNLITQIDRTITSFGQDYLVTYMVTRPLNTIVHLTQRQNAIKELCSNAQLRNAFIQNLHQVKKAEQTFFALYREESGFNKKAINKLYFCYTWPLVKELRSLNSRPLAMQTITLMERIPSLALTIGMDVMNIFTRFFAHTLLHAEDTPEIENVKTTSDALKLFVGKHGRTGLNDGLEGWWNSKNPYPVYTQKIEELQKSLSTSQSIANTNNLHKELLHKQLKSSWGDQMHIVEKNYKNTMKEAAEWRSKYKDEEEYPKRIEFLAKWNYRGYWMGAAAHTALKGYLIWLAKNREVEYNNITNYLHTQLIAAADIVRSMEKCSQLIAHNAALAHGLEHKQDLLALFDEKNTTVSPKLHRLVNILLTNTFSGKASYFSLKGRVLAAYSLMQDVKEEFAPALRALAEVDAFISTATLYNEFSNKNVRYSFATYLEKERPEITLTDMWNPFIARDKVVTNSLTLGNNARQNIILTGPNAGGKSTFLKGTCLSILLAQTLTITPAKELIFTPFAKITTYMNITDDTAGGNSLFKSEVLRAQRLLNSIKSLEGKNFSFSIADEIFSGTSPKEGAAAGCALAKNLGQCQNSILLVATHFPLLTGLETTTHNFNNYQVRVIRHEDGTFSYPFKLEKGIADQNVAMDILQQQGFDASILNDAQALLKI